MVRQTFRFYTHTGNKAWVSANGYTPRVGDEVSLPRMYFPSLYESTDAHPSECWEVERVIHRFDDEEFIGVDVYISRIEYYKLP